MNQGLKCFKLLEKPIEWIKNTDWKNDKKKNSTCQNSHPIKLRSLARKLQMTNL